MLPSVLLHVSLLFPPASLELVQFPSSGVSNFLPPAVALTFHSFVFVSILSLLLVTFIVMFEVLFPSFYLNFSVTSITTIGSRFHRSYLFRRSPFTGVRNTLYLSAILYDPFNNMALIVYGPFHFSSN